MKKFSFHLILLLLLNSYGAYAQKIGDTVLNGWYTGTLEEVLDRIAAEKNLKFSFNREYAKKITISEPPFKRSLDDFMKYVVCKNNKLKYIIDDDQTIHVVEIWKQLDQKEVVKREKVFDKASRHNVSLSGKIVDITTYETLPFVNLVVTRTKTGTSTNADGLFTLLNIPNDTSSVLISYIGYKPYLLKLTPEMSLQNMTIAMEPATELLNEVVILSEKQDLLQTNEQVGVIKMTPLKMNVLPSLGEKDIFRTFQLMPGISAANENSSGLYVRGGTPDQSLVLYDGIPIYNVQHLFGFYSAFNSNAIKDIQLYKGGFDAKYGGRLSSLVEITGKEGTTKGFGAMADISLMSANAYIEFPIGKKITFLAAGRRSWQSPLYNRILKQSNQSGSSTPSGPSDMPDGGGMKPPGGGMPQNDAGYDSYFYDVNAKVTYRPSDKDILSMSFYNGADDLDNNFNPSGGHGSSSFSINNSDKTKWGNTGSALRWARNWNLRLYSNMLFTYSHYFNNRDRESSVPTSITSSSTTTETLAEDNKLDDFSARLDFEYALNEHQRLMFGVQANRTNTSYGLTENDTLTVLDNTSNATLVAFYLQDKLNLFDQRLQLNGGVRGNYYSPTGKVYFEPRLSASYDLTRKWKLKGSTGYYYQFAKKITREDIMQGNRDFWLAADGDLMPVGRSLQGVAGFSYETNGYLIDIEGYYKKLYDISEYSIRTTSMTSDNGGRPGVGGMGSENQNSASTIYSDRFYTGDGYARGFDVLLQKKYGNITGWISYTWGQVIHNFPDISSYKYYASNDVTHEFKVVGIYKWRNWDFSANWLLATGKPYTAPEGLYQVTLPDGTEKTFFTISEKNGKRLPSYHRLDIAATYNFKIASKVPCSVNLSFFNLYNRKNVWYKEFQVVDNEITETNINYMGFTPNLNFSIKF